MNIINRFILTSSESKIDGGALLLCFGLALFLTACEDVADHEEHEAAKADSIVAENEIDKVSENTLSLFEEIEYFKKRLADVALDSATHDADELIIDLPNDTKLGFIKIPATTSSAWKNHSGGKDYYLMGDNIGEYSPARMVKLDYDFYVGKTEITRK